MDIAGLPANRKHSLSEIEPPQQPLFRKPFSPISSTESSKSLLQQDFNKKQEILQKTFQITTPFTTPSKPISSILDDENKTPKTNMIPMVPYTPSTVSVPMQTSMTPCLNNNNKIKEMVIPEEIIEYSFEERRAGFVLPRAHLKTVVAVV